MARRKPLWFSEHSPCSNPCYSLRMLPFGHGDGVDWMDPKEVARYAQANAVWSDKAKIKSILVRKGARSPAWERLLEDVQTSDDQLYLERLKEAATECKEADGAWQPQAQHLEAYLDMLVWRIDRRLGLLDKIEIRSILAHKGPEGRAWKRLLKGVESSDDRLRLERLKTAAAESKQAEGAWQPLGKGFEIHLDDLVWRIDSRLSLLDTKGQGH
jgi:hypothetical protein